MTDDRLPLAELAAKSGDAEFLRAIAENVLQLIMEADVDGLIGAGRYERGETRQTWRNGYRDRTLDTRLGTLNLKIPKMGSGAYFPGFLEPRKTVEKALVAVIQEAWINGVSTRKVDELGAGHGHDRHLEVVSVEAVQGYRRAGERLPQARPCRRLAVSVARRHLSEGARGRAHRLGGGDNRGRRQH
jgi:transposase-like protein